MGFDTDSTMCIVDNSANAHIWTMKENCVPGILVQLMKSDTLGVATFRGGGG